MILKVSSILIKIEELQKMGKKVKYIVVDVVKITLAHHL